MIPLYRQRHGVKPYQTFFYALGLLTRLPTPKIGGDVQQVLANGLHPVGFYPWVGACIGALLIAVALFSQRVFPDLVAALLVLIAWVWVTGALHLDGLADSIDAAFVHHSAPERTLAVFRDPFVGSMAVVGIVLTLLAKFVLILAALQQQVLFVLLFAPLFSRLMLGVYIALSPYARERGLASHTRGYRLGLGFIVTTLIAAAAAIIAVGVLTTLVIFSGVAMGLWWWRGFWLRRINGYTGDTLGAFVELAELLVLLLYFSTAEFV